MKNIFISYSSKDRGIAKSICVKLESYYDVFIDFSGIPGGTKWENEIEFAIRESDVFLLIVTPRSTSSDWVTKETLFAEHLRKPIIPALFEENMPFRIINLQYVDFRGDFESGYIELLEAIQAHAPARPRNEHEADYLLGSCIRARLNGKIDTSERLLKQAFVLDNSIKRYKSNFWSKLINAKQAIDLTILSNLSILEESKVLEEQFYPDTKAYDWSIFLEGSDEVLNLIEYVMYKLHPTFKPEYQIVRSRTNGFRLEQIGWGRFKVGLRIKLINGQSVFSSYFLSFKKKNKQKLDISITNN